ncbi:hypothetical protein DSECCO2_321800 [anaerobic digester metagenome]
MLELAAGTYPVPHAGLRYELARDLRLPRGSWLRLRGENGAGKTTFLEHVLIPNLRDRHCLLYLAQDMDLQQNTMRATLALMGLEAPQGLADLASAWIEAGGCREVVILDEFDKYLTAPQLDTLGLDRFGWVVQVSHLERPGARPDLPFGFELTFKRPDVGRPEVHLGMERLWPA